MQRSTRAFAQRILGENAWQRLGLLRTQLMLRRFTPYRIQREFAGVPLSLWIADPLAKAWYERGYEPHAVPEMELLRTSRLCQGATVFDLGAHQAVHALMLGDAVGTGGRVIAVEADAHNVRVAERNRELNGAEQLTIVPAAVGDRVGTAWFTQNSANGAIVTRPNRSVHREVPMTTIDRLAHEHGLPHVIYLDVEGHECHAMRGASEVLRSLPDCFVEVHVGAGLEAAGGSVPELLGHFRNEQYRVLVAPAVTRKRFVPIDSVGSDFFESRFYLLALARES